MAMCLVVLFSLVVGLLSVAYLFIKRQQCYWKHRNVPYLEPTFFIGNLKGAGKEKHYSQCFREAYTKLKGLGPFAGYYALFRPVALVLDLDFVRNVLIKDFSNFTDRGFFYNEKSDPLTGHLFALDGKKWKFMRNKLSPTFSSGKMKFMYPTVVEVAKRFVDAFGRLIEVNDIIEINELLSRFTTDVIGTCAFGIECNSLNDPNAQFHVMGRNLFTQLRHNPLIIGLMHNYPDLARKFGLKLLRDDLSEFFVNVVRETVAFREKNGVKRNDFMDSLIDLQKAENIPSADGAVESRGLTLEEAAAQAFVFFIAGFETSSSTMGFCLYELALHQHIQTKAREEINKVSELYDGQLPYESMETLKYLDQIIDETLRKYPIAPALYRKALNDYKVPNTESIIEKGTTVIIPSIGFHYDPEIYPDPDKFDPDRFLPEEVNKRHPCAWLPFGDGPRNCVGMRFGKMQTRVGLAFLLKHFRFTACGRTVIPLAIDLQHELLRSKGGIVLKVERIS